MQNRLNIVRHGVPATLQPIGTGYWRISIDDGRGGRFEHAGSRDSADYRAGWECWCYQRLRENLPMLMHREAQAPHGPLSAWFDAED